MAPLTKDRAHGTHDGIQFGDPVAAGAVIYAGALVQLDAAGNALPAVAGGNTVRGIAMVQANNAGGSAGDITVEIRKGTFRFANNGLTRADIGTIVKVTDDQTVGGAGAADAGELVDIDAGGAWVKIS
ncbi:DUF2190 family protein [Tropicimonas sp. S265A]|uniref:DUF2190 family protein n=1 Tax=Tropicimonas sp. S265A TaxID=3415134 RepID=UPI003C7D4B73